ncbi:YbaB/EbfC family nucleoid-associated protein [Paractinoplanes atraurantiacus]|uniref:YbaB/EbfC DNA-binding family protein n=1 Tax=Paractinoplanes atraurantiacus TaxID=1036182 RepID=A0A285K9W2_9ACTN|nr:YbaB/EbfC family nucleoid-associated protein [Actinoplanes atraurantiacus]SNY69380.1 YbaB/EbfC DNA-binding family protein [Actinoplanes atraurantiacus]
MSDVDAAEEWLDSWVASVDERAATAVELSRRVAALTGESRSRDGLLGVTVGSAGQLTALHIDDRARQRTGSELSREIMALVRRAQERLSSQVADQVRETVGADTETGRAVIHSYAERFPETGEDDHAR